LFFSRELYQDALDNVSAFNARLCFERKMRAPFLDAQTGIAMNNCHLWLSRFMRREPKTPQYIYTYPQRRWRKRKRIYHPENEEEEGSHVENEGLSDLDSNASLCEIIWHFGHFYFVLFVLFVFIRRSLYKGVYCLPVDHVDGRTTELKITATLCCRT
jgi:hypothetical protein